MRDPESAALTEAVTPRTGTGPQPIFRVAREAAGVTLWWCQRAGMWVTGRRHATRYRDLSKAQRAAGDLGSGSTWRSRRRAGAGRGEGTERRRPRGPRPADASGPARAWGRVTRVAQAGYTVPASEL
jgi:hypothetical protein